MESERIQPGESSPNRLSTRFKHEKKEKSYVIDYKGVEMKLSQGFEKKVKDVLT